MTKKTQLRVQYLHDTSDNWDNCEVRSLKGELYTEKDVNNNKFLLRIGDGINNVCQLNHVSLRKRINTQPSTQTKLIYNSADQQPTWQDFKAEELQQSGSTVESQAGKYETVFTPKLGFCWEDDSIIPRVITWSIEKKPVTLTPSTENIKFSLNNTVTITYSGRGNFELTYSEDNIFTAEFTNNNTIEIHGIKEGEADLMVKFIGDNNHEDAECIIHVHIDTLLNKVLDENTWEMIARAAKEKIASNLWSIGDTKKIVFAEKATNNNPVFIGDYCILTSPRNRDVFIIGFDHNAEIEGYGITFGTFKSDGTDLCLVDNCYSSGSSSKKCFNMNHYSNTRDGGWRGCDLRYDILGSTDQKPIGYDHKLYVSRKDSNNNPSRECATNPVPNTFMAALPEDLRKVMTPIRKVTDNNGSEMHDSTPNTISASIDYLPLLSEFEVHGVRHEANIKEQTQQSQYAYYKSNSKSKYRDISQQQIEARWWSRSIEYDNSPDFMVFHGAADCSDAHISLGVSPIFKVNKE